MCVRARWSVLGRLERVITVNKTEGSATVIKQQLRGVGGGVRCGLEGEGGSAGSRYKVMGGKGEPGRD